MRTGRIAAVIFLCVLGGACHPAGSSAGGGGAPVGPTKPAPPPPGGAAAPSIDQCQAVVRHLHAVMPDTVAGSHDDVTECLNLPAALVDCLAGAEAKDAIEKCIDDFPDPAHPKVVKNEVSREECTKAIGHLRQLHPEFAKGEDDDDLIKGCVESGTRAEIDCISAAKTYEEAEKCE